MSDIDLKEIELERTTPSVEQQAGVCPTSLVELRAPDCPLLGILDADAMLLRVKKGQRIFEVDLIETARTKSAVIAHKTLTLHVGADDSSKVQD